MQKIPQIILETDNFHNEIKKVALVTAREIAEAGITEKNADDFYVTSGLQLIFRMLINDGVIRDNIDAVFIESSTLISTIESNKLDAFTLVWQNDGKETDPGGNIQLRKNVEAHFKNMVIELRNNHESLFNHPSFFIKPKKIETFISFLDGGLEELKQQAMENSRFEESLGEAIKLFAKYNDRSFDQPGQRIDLHQTYDSLKRRDVYVNSSGVSSPDIDYYKMKSQATLAKYLRTAKDPYTLHLLTHALYDRFFIGSDHSRSGSRKSVLISLPLLGSKARLDDNFRNYSNIKYDGLGALFIFLVLREEQSFSDTGKKESSEKIKRDAKSYSETLPVFFERLENYCTTIPNLLKDFQHGYTFHISEKLRNDIEQHATKSAIAAVMSRNMSHNIGSHVLSKLANLDNKAVEELCRKKYTDTSYWINQGKIFYGYLQKRMEFIADISTAETIITNASLFQKDILNKFKTVGKNNDYPHFISDFISGVEGVNSKTIKIKGYYKDSTGVYDLNQHSSRDILVDLPNDTLGAHALYVMLENIIRNASKHNQVTGNLELKLLVEDSHVSPGYYEVSIVDNQHETLQKKYISDPLKNDLPRIINKIISKQILENGKVRDSAWGILELKICAAYLAKQKLELLDTVKINELPLIRAAFFDQDGQIDTSYTHFNFGFKCWLRKPKLVLVAVDDPEQYKMQDGQHIEKEMNNNGIYLVDKSGLSDLLQNGTEHEYLVVLQQKGETIRQEGLSNLTSNQKIIIIDAEATAEFSSFLQSPATTHAGMRERLVSLYYPDTRPEDCTAEFEGRELDKNKALVSEGRTRAVPLLVIRSAIGNVVFDQHDNAKQDDNLPEKLDYWEYCGSQSGTVEIVSAAKNSRNFLNELVDAALSKIVILDERVQENTSQEDKNNLAAANILVPSRDEVDLMQQYFGDNSLENTMMRLLALSPHYFIVHLGVIEKYLKATTRQEIKDWINKKFKLPGENEERSLEQRTRLIIISGRGKPPTLPGRSLYLPYSLVAQCVLPANQASKLKLIQLLNKARRYE